MLNFIYFILNSSLVSQFQMGCVKSNPKPQGKPLPNTSNPPSGINGPAVVGNNGAQSNISNPAGNIGLAAQ